MRNESILEIDVNDIQDHYNGNNVSYDDLVNFADNVSKNKQSQPKTNQQSIVNNQGFYVSQSDYIEYQIAKREAVKRDLRRKKFNGNIHLTFLWILKTVFSIILICVIFWGFYMLCWSLQQTF